MGKHRILVVDDDHDILDLLLYNLDREGFVVMTLNESINAVSVCRSFEPDLVILDIMMPDKNGIEVCREIRAIDRFKDTFIFFLTAKSEHYYEQAALDTGGDDFIEKIIGIRSLTDKIKTVLKRNLIIRKRITMVQVGRLYVDRMAMSARFGKQEIQLSKPEFELLFFFAQNSSKVIRVDNLLLKVWGMDYLSIGYSLEAHMGRLMDHLGGRWLYKVAASRYTLLPE